MNTPTLIHHLVELLAKSVLVLSAVLLLTALLRRRSAALRHAILLAAFVSLLLLPLSKLAVPRWSLFRSGAANPTLNQFLPAVTVTGILAPVDAVPAEAPTRFSWPEPSQLAIGLWLTGAAVLLGIRAFGGWQIATLRRTRTTPAATRFSVAAENVARELGCATRHEVRFSAAARVPCTWGVRRAVVLLPEDAMQWSEAHFVAALRHEFAHVARRDYFTRWLSYAVCVLYWPNPLVWFAARELYAAQEQACDDLVLRAGTPSADYATLLFETARACTGAPIGWRNAIAMARPSTLENRVVAVVDETRDRRPTGRLVKLMGGIGAAGVVGMSALAQVGDAKPAAPADAAPAEQQVEIRAKFIEVPKGGMPVDQIAAVFDALEKNKPLEIAGVELLSSPRLIVRSGQSGMIKIGEERPLPPGSDPKYQFVGTSLEVVPTVAGGKIAIQCKVEVVSVAGKDPATQRSIYNHRESKSDLNLANGGKAVLPPMASKKAGREIFTVIVANIVAPAAASAPAGTSDGKAGDTAQDPPSVGDPTPDTLNSTEENAPVPKSKEMLLPVDIHADTISVEGEMSIATGNVRSKYGTATITADSVRYNRTSRRAEFRGKVEMKTEGGTMRGETMSVEFAEDGRISIGGAGAASDVFLSAYMTFQRGEKAEATGKIEAGIVNFNQTISLLDQVSQRWPTWNPAIVKLRHDRAVEALGKLQAKGPTGQPGASRSHTGADPGGYTVDLSIPPEAVDFEGFINYDNSIQTKSNKVSGQQSSK
jgi:beta-lactamase regulating signal transducer with metallopeptidase domain